MTEAAQRRKTAIDHSRRKDERVAMLFVVHGETPASLRLSTDGNPAHAHNLYKSTIAGKPLIFQARRDGDFLLAHLPGWMCIKFGLVQTNVPALSGAVAWSPDQIAAWRALRPEMLRLRHQLERSSRRRRKQPKPPSSPMPFGMYS